MSTTASPMPALGSPNLLRLLRDALVGALPALAAVAVLELTAELRWWQLLLALAIGAVTALLVAWSWIRQVRHFAAWVLRLAGQERADDPPEPYVVYALEWIVWPVLELMRTLARTRRHAAAQERLLAAVIEALPDPVFLVDQSLVVRLANRAARRGFALPPGEVPLGRALRDPAIFGAVQAALGGGISGSVVYNPVSDRLKQFAARVEPVDLGDGGRGVILALREQTEQVMIERMRSDFVANASHEIRTPLASLIGFIETLRGPARDDQEAREMFLATMAEEAARMTRLVDDLLSLSRIEVAESRRPEERIELPELLARMAETLRPVAERSGVALELALAPLPPVRGDADQLHQLFGNLLDNAVKYGASGKRVRIEAEALPMAPPEAGPLSGRAAVRVAVIDFGEGIPPEHIPRLTERFYRVDKARSRRVGGTGLGLAIVKHILRRHEGHLAIQSELGRGSRFTVYLPVEES
ncbi:sensor histidine kinase [Benzoatithermus flavus]|uniref:histidine kinase n=1 Tax=Benzoatithermus flavus TaxID=3108223 RepID=A0ABU8XKX9_9PROT